MQLKATDQPTDACCWWAHLEDMQGRDVADVCDLETAQEIARRVNAHDELVAALGRVAKSAGRDAIQDARKLLARLGKPETGRPEESCPTGFAASVHDAGLCLCDPRRRR